MCEGLPEHWSYCVTLALTGSTCGPKAWPEWREGGFLRMDYSEACSNQRGRGMTKTSSMPPPPHLPAPSALSLSKLQCLFSGRPGFLRDGAVDERRKRGLGQRGKDRHRERWMGMGRRSCARSGFGGVCRIGCFLEAGRESEDRGGQSTNLSLRQKSDFFASCAWECEQSRLAGSSSGLNLRENTSILWISRNHKGIWTWSFVLSHAWKTNSALHWAKHWANATISTGRGHQQT